MAFSTIWSIDVGRSSLKAVQLRRDQNNIEIMAVDKIDYPIGKNGVDAAAAGREALGIFRSRHGVRGPVAVVHPGQGTFSRFIKVPAFDEKRVNEMVGYEASQQIPFPLDEVTWDFHIVQRDYLPGEEREIALFAIRREAVDDFLVDFANESLDVELISIGYLGVLNFVAHDIRPEEASIVLDLGAAHTDLILVDGSRFWIRPIPHSGGDMTRAIMSRFRLAYPEAERLKLESSRAPKQAIKIFQAVIQPKLKELVGEIHRSIGFYRSQAGELNFKRLYLLGNGSKTIGIKKFLEEQLAIPVVRVQSIQHFRVNRDVDLKLLQTQLPSFASALGCALQGVGTALCEVDLVPREDKLRREIGRKRKHAF
ncbi:MAG: type IV pilus assembly protein PilM, partial [Planctomycetes bacterium]|nr:type IV pilus assembly protein PilM [Planctomycetota bacterium]